MALYTHEYWLLAAPSATRTTRGSQPGVSVPQKPTYDRYLTNDSIEIIIKPNQKLSMHQFAVKTILPAQCLII